MTVRHFVQTLQSVRVTSRCLYHTLAHYLLQTSPSFTVRAGLLCCMSCWSTIGITVIIFIQILFLWNHQGCSVLKIWYHLYFSNICIILKIVKIWYDLNNINWTQQCTSTSSSFRVELVVVNSLKILVILSTLFPVSSHCSILFSVLDVLVTESANSLSLLASSATTTLYSLMFSTLLILKFFSPESYIALYIKIRIILNSVQFPL